MVKDRVEFIEKRKYISNRRKNVDVKGKELETSFSTSLKRKLDYA